MISKLNTVLLVFHFFGQLHFQRYVIFFGSVLRFGSHAPLPPTHTHTHKHTHTYTRTHKRTHTRLHTHTHKHTHAQTHARTHTLITHTQPTHTTPTAHTHTTQVFYRLHVYQTVSIIRLRVNHHSFLPLFT